MIGDFLRGFKMAGFVVATAALTVVMTAPASSTPAQEVKQDKNRDKGKKGKNPEASSPALETVDNSKDPNLQPQFTVGPLDVLFVNVWKEPELTSEVQVRGDCRITMNLIKEVEVCGLTPPQIEKLLSEKLSKFITAPDVAVTLRQWVSRKIYLIGNVRRSGSMVLNGQMTVAQAIAEAGGLTEFANDKKIVIMRKEGDKTEQLFFNHRNYMNGKDDGGNILLKPGDQIIVK